MTLRWKLVAILVVLVAFSAVGVYPIVAARYGIHSPAVLMDKQLKLGLDLKGGVHLVLRVQTDDALRLETDQAAEHLREALRMRNIPVTSISTPSSTDNTTTSASVSRTIPTSVSSSANGSGPKWSAR